MPFVHFSTTIQLSETEKERLSGKLAECVRLLPGKPAERTMIRIDSGCNIYRGGAQAACAFTETIFQKPLELSDQRAYVESLYALCGQELGLEEAQVYCAMVDLDTWGSRGTLH